ncbi:MAG: NosD domain-containing protein [Candidatus Bathyarchaeia archaeon]
MKRIVSEIMTVLFLTSMLISAFNIQPVKCEWTGGTIYISTDGSIEPANAPVITYDYVTYTLTDNIGSSAHGIVIKRDNIIINGMGYTIRCIGSGSYRGISLENRKNVTIKNTKIKNFYYGIYFNYSSNCEIYGNSITSNTEGIYFGGDSSNNAICENDIAVDEWMNCGIHLIYSSNNTIYKNNMIVTSGDGILVEQSSNNEICENSICAQILFNSWAGIYLKQSSNNKIYGNDIKENSNGIYFEGSSNNAIYGNNLTRNRVGIWLQHASNNKFYHNNFVQNQWYQVYTFSSVNVWNDGYPSGGNYWSDYLTLYPGADELDNSGLWDTPYVIDKDNQDHYPLIHIYAIPEFSSAIILPLLLASTLLVAIFAKRKNPN